MPASSPTRRPWLLRIGVGAVLLLLFLGVFITHQLRDRHPHYTVKLHTSNISPTAAPAPKLSVGFATRSITPAVNDPNHPVWVAGFGQHRQATTVHDPLEALATVIQSGSLRLGIVVLDAIGFMHDDVIDVRTRVASSLHLDHVVVCSTHNHSTPDLMGIWGPGITHTGVDPAYRASVILAASEALIEAASRLEPASLSLLEIPTSPAGLVSDTRLPEVFDPDLRMLLFRSVPGSPDRILGSIVTWANHPETPWSQNTELTADFPGFLRRALQSGVRYDGQIRRPGLGGTHLFINGAVGGLMTPHPSLTIRDPFLNQNFKTPSHDKSRALGHNLAARVLDGVASLQTPPDLNPTLAIHAETLNLPLDNPNFILAPILGLINRGQVQWRTLRTEVNFIQLGQASILCVPGEIYPEIVNGGVVRAPGGDYDIDPVEAPPLRALMPGQVRFIFGLANDEIGYIIPRSEWDSRPPHLFGAPKAPYGEVNSLGPSTAPLLYQALKSLMTPDGGTPPPVQPSKTKPI